MKNIQHCGKNLIILTGQNPIAITVYSVGPCTSLFEKSPPLFLTVPLLKIKNNEARHAKNLSTVATWFLHTKRHNMCITD